MLLDGKLCQFDSSQAIRIILYKELDKKKERKQQYLATQLNIL